MKCDSIELNIKSQCNFSPIFFSSDESISSQSASDSTENKQHDECKTVVTYLGTGQKFFGDLNGKCENKVGKKTTEI